MKKLLMVIFSLTLLLPLGVLAETIDSVEAGNNSSNSTVSVGKVAVPIYNVYVAWEDLSFDWTYDPETKTFNWAYPTHCSQYYYSEPIEIEERLNSGKPLYSDSECKNKVYDSGGTETFYEIHEHAPYIRIEDFSQNTSIVPSIKWTSEEEYSYVKGKFSYSSGSKPVCTIVDEELVKTAQNYFDVNAPLNIYTDASCTIELEEPSKNLEANKFYAFVPSNTNTRKEITGEIPEDARHHNIYAPTGGFWDSEEYIEKYGDGYIYSIKLDLENQSTPTNTPKPGDIIGTVTISIRAAE